MGLLFLRFIPFSYFLVVALAVANKCLRFLGGKLYRTENGNETKTRKEKKEEERREKKMKMSQRVLCCLNEAGAGNVVNQQATKQKKNKKGKRLLSKNKDL